MDKQTSLHGRSVVAIRFLRLAKDTPFKSERKQITFLQAVDGQSVPDLVVQCLQGSWSWAGQEASHKAWAATAHLQQQMASLAAQQHYQQYIDGTLGRRCASLLQVHHCTHQSKASWLLAGTSDSGKLCIHSSHVPQLLEDFFIEGGHCRIKQLQSFH